MVCANDNEKLKKSPKMAVFDFFCGCGGTSAGFREAGMDIVWALDVNPAAAKVYKARQVGNAVPVPLANAVGEEFFRLAYGKHGTVDRSVKWKFAS